MEKDTNVQNFNPEFWQSAESFDFLVCTLKLMPDDQLIDSFIKPISRAGRKLALRELFHRTSPEANKYLEKFLTYHLIQNTLKKQPITLESIQRRAALGETNPNLYVLLQCARVDLDEILDQDTIFSCIKLQSELNRTVENLFYYFLRPDGLNCLLFMLNLHIFHFTKHILESKIQHAENIGEVKKMLADECLDLIGVKEIPIEIAAETRKELANVIYAIEKNSWDPADIEILLYKQCSEELRLTILHFSRYKYSNIVFRSFVEILCENLHWSLAGSMAVFLEAVRMSENLVVFLESAQVIDLFKRLGNISADFPGEKPMIGMTFFFKVFKHLDENTQEACFKEIKASYVHANSSPQDSETFIDIVEIFNVLRNVLRNCRSNFRRLAESIKKELAGDMLESIDSSFDVENFSLLLSFVKYCSEEYIKKAKAIFFKYFNEILESELNGSEVLCFWKPYLLEHECVGVIMKIIEKFKETHSSYLLEYAEIYLDCLPALNRESFLEDLNNDPDVGAKEVNKVSQFLMKHFHFSNKTQQERVLSSNDSEQMENSSDSFNRFFQ